MDCLNCDTPMQNVRKHGVTHEHCYVCGAYFFDGGELQTVLAARGLALDEKTLGSRPAPPDSCRWCDARYPPGTRMCSPCNKPLGHHCPRGHGPMPVVRSHGVELDLCGTCGGVWFDGKELQAFTKGIKTGARDAQRDARLADKCQICGAETPESALTLESGFKRCKDCRRRDDGKSPEERARLEAEYLAHWRRQAAYERDVADDIHDAAHGRIIPRRPRTGFGLLLGAFDWLIK